jgi:hypothetical protein
LIFILLIRDTLIFDSSLYVKLKLETHPSIVATIKINLSAMIRKQVIEVSKSKILANFKVS